MARTMHDSSWLCHPTNLRSAPVTGDRAGIRGSSNRLVVEPVSLKRATCAAHSTPLPTIITDELHASCNWTTVDDGRLSDGARNHYRALLREFKPVKFQIQIMRPRHWRTSDGMCFFNKWLRLDTGSRRMTESWSSESVGKSCGQVDAWERSKKCAGNVTSDGIVR